MTAPRSGSRAQRTTMGNARTVQRARQSGLNVAVDSASVHLAEQQVRKAVLEVISVARETADNPSAGMIDALQKAVAEMDRCSAVAQRARRLIR